MSHPYSGCCEKIRSQCITSEWPLRSWGVDRFAKASAWHAQTSHYQNLQHEPRAHTHLLSLSQPWTSQPAQPPESNNLPFAAQIFITLSVGTTICPFGIALHRAYGLRRLYRGCTVGISLQTALELPYPNPFSPHPTLLIHLPPSPRRPWPHRSSHLPTPHPHPPYAQPPPPPLLRFRVLPLAPLPFRGELPPPPRSPQRNQKSPPRNQRSPPRNQASPPRNHSNPARQTGPPQNPAGVAPTRISRRSPIDARRKPVSPPWTIGL